MAKKYMVVWTITHSTLNRTDDYHVYLDGNSKENKLQAKRKYNILRGNSKVYSASIVRIVESTESHYVDTNKFILLWKRIKTKFFG